MDSTLFAETNRCSKKRLTIGFGLEQLKYEEKLSDTGLHSKSKVNNLITSIDGIIRREKIFMEARATLPISKGESSEEWRISSGALYQTNNLEYGWKRYDAIIGYNLIDWFNPYGGLRWSKVKQKRTDFVKLGVPVTATAVESIRSRSFLAGIMGSSNITDRLSWNYSLEYFYPIDVEVTNSALPGFKATDKDGYVYEIKASLEFFSTDALSFGLNLYRGKIHWNGSDWLPYGGGLAKWPQNDTDYLGGTLNINLRY